MVQKRANDGRYTESVSDDDILFFFQTGDRPFYGTNEVADEFDLSGTQARRRLESLADAGELEEVDLSDRHRAWRLDRDVIVLRPEADGYSAHDTTTGVASDGDSRAAALRSLADAVALADDAETEDVDLEGVDVDIDDGDGSSPFDE